MTVKYGTAARNAKADAFTALLNGGALEIRSGAAPTNPGDADSGTLLGSKTFGSPAFGAASTGVATANSFTGGTAVASGTAAHFRAKSSGGTVQMQGTVTATGGGGDLTIDTTTIVSGGTFNVTSLTYTEPAS
jgi:hypothetical protein